MKIDLENVYVGNIMRCTRYEEYTNNVVEDEFGANSFGEKIIEGKIYKDNALLLKVTDNGFVDLDELNGYLDYLKINKSKTKFGFRLGGLILAKTPWKMNSFYVSDVQEYSKENQNGKVKLKDLKKNRNHRNI